MTYTVVLVREADGRYSVSVPALKGCHTWGDSVDHALKMAEEAIGLYLEVLAEDNEEIPVDSPSVSLDMSDVDEALVYKLTVGKERQVA